MGSSVSRAAAPAAPPSTAAPTPGPLPQAKDNENKAAKKVDYLKLPCPVIYELIHQKTFVSLYPEPFEGLRLNFTAGLNQNFILTADSVLMGYKESPRGIKPKKTPAIYYEAGGNFNHPKFKLVGRILPGCHLNARAIICPTNYLMMNIYAQIEGRYNSNGKISIEYKGKDYTTQFQMGRHGLYSLNYLQSVTPNLSLGTEVHWLSHELESGIGFAARYNTDKMVAAGQVTGTGAVLLSYWHKVSEKVFLASDFICKPLLSDATASFGCYYRLQQCSFRGKIDSNGVVSVFLEQAPTKDVKFIVSVVVDHMKKTSILGIGATAKL